MRKRKMKWTQSKNQRRGTNARKALDFFNYLQTDTTENFVMDEEMGTVIVDLLTNLMHLTNREVVEGALNSAKGHYDVEAGCLGCNGDNCYDLELLCDECQADQAAETADAENRFGPVVSITKHQPKEKPSDLIVCNCCKETFDPNDDRESKNSGIYGDNVCFRCYHADKDGCAGCDRVNHP